MWPEEQKAIDSEGWRWWWKQEITWDRKYVLCNLPRPGSESIKQMEQKPRQLGRLCQPPAAVVMWMREGGAAVGAYGLWTILNPVILLRGRDYFRTLFSTSPCLPCKSLMARVQCLVASCLAIPFVLAGSLAALTVCVRNLFRRRIYSRQLWQKTFPNKTIRKVTVEK